MLSEIAISDEKAFAQLVTKAKDAFKIILIKRDGIVISFYLLNSKMPHLIAKIRHIC